MFVISSYWHQMKGDSDPEEGTVCPYCKEPLAGNPVRPGYALACDNCDREWRSQDELDAEARDVVALEAYMARRP